MTSSSSWSYWTWVPVILATVAILWAAWAASGASRRVRPGGPVDSAAGVAHVAAAQPDYLEAEILRLRAENSRLSSALELSRRRAEMLERAQQGRRLGSSYQDSQAAAPVLRAEQVQGLRSDIEALQGFADLADRWHDQMTLVIRNNLQLKEQLESFEKIVKSFDVVAINAAITAAKAGVHGRGFGVVAEFVRELSSKTAREASEYMRMVDYNTMITTTTFQEIQASGNLIKTAMFSLKAGVDRLKPQ